MKKFIFALTMLTLSSLGQASELPTERFERYIASWDNCANTSECGNISLEINSYVNHPDHQVDLRQCESDSDCYDAMTLLATKLITEIEKVF